ncbi:hypothetical protein [Bacillus sp. FSL K6-3431]|uniref:hypothetical protein n=1 Tax=Bacillus sp. FSL K6-3431 TaxID=2921500 RepID=UPI0030F80446
MKAIITLTNGEVFTITGAIVADIHGYFTGNRGPHAAPTIGWVGTPQFTINMNHAIHVKFEEVGE